MTTKLDEMRAIVSDIRQMVDTGGLEALRKVIHDITDDCHGDIARTPAEHALLALDHACEARDWDRTNEAAADLCAALADESRALRLAAAAVFGAEFRRKGDPT